MNNHLHPIWIQQTMRRALIGLLMESIQMVGPANCMIKAFVIRRLFYNEGYGRTCDPKAAL